MPAAILVWLAANWTTLVWEVSAPIAIRVLRYFGVISWAQDLEDRMYAKLKTAKTYHAKEDFPGGVNGKPDTPFYSDPGTTNTNMTVGQAPVDDGFPKDRNSGL